MVFCGSGDGGGVWMHHDEVCHGGAGDARHDICGEAPARLHLASRLYQSEREGRHHQDRKLAHEICGARGTRHALSVCARHHPAALPRDGVCREAAGVVAEGADLDRYHLADGGNRHRGVEAEAVPAAKIKDRVTE